MNDQEESVAYYKELDFIRELENRNDNFRDQTLIQLSVGLFAILAAFGGDILKTDTTLSNITVIFLAITILVLVIGFYTNSKMYSAIRDKMTKNVQNGNKFYDDYTDTPWQGVNSALNYASLSLFSISIIFASVLIIIYIGGLNA